MRQREERCHPCRAEWNPQRQSMLTSPDNPLVRRLVACQDPRKRREEGLVVVEGRRAIDGCLSAGWLPAHLLVREDLTPPAHWPPATPMGARVADRLSQASSPSGYLAAFPEPVVPALDIHAGGLLLAGVADPGNTGTLIRTAAALALPQVVIAGGADPWAAKVVQATAGSIAAVTIHILGDHPELLTGGAPRCALVVSGGQPPSALKPGPRWLVVGGEANGIPERWLATCAEHLTLPMPGGTESLNAAVAGSIAAYLLACPTA